MTELSFNPYFNGYSTLTIKRIADNKNYRSFNPYFNGYSTLTGNTSLPLVLNIIFVSILILMDTLL